MGVNVFIGGNVICWNLGIVVATTSKWEIVSYSLFFYFFFLLLLFWVTGVTEEREVTVTRE